LVKKIVVGENVGHIPNSGLPVWRIDKKRAEI